MKELINLKSMDVEEKIILMERLWNDLINNDDYRSPEWHEDILIERENRRKNGKEKMFDWEQVRKNLNKFL